MNKDQFKNLQAKLESIWNEDSFIVNDAPVEEADETEVAEAADGPKEQLMDIMEQLRQLSAEAAGIMAEHFPQAHRQGEAYGAFNFGSSNNRYDTTFESILDSLDDESDSNFEDAANELDYLIRSGMDDEQALQKVVSKYDVPIEELEDYMGR